jgi:hypothetical protein
VNSRVATSIRCARVAWTRSAFLFMRLPGTV